MKRTVFLLLTAAVVAVLSLPQASSGQKAEQKADIEKLKAQIKELELRNKTLLLEAASQRELAERLKQLTEEAFRKLKVAAARAEESVKAREAADKARREADEARLEAENRRRLVADLDRKAADEHLQALAALLEINVAYFEKVLVEQPKNADARGILAQTFVEAAKLHYVVGNLDQAEAQCANAIAQYRDLIKTKPAAAKYSQALAGSLHQMGKIQMKQDRADRAVKNLRQAIEVGEKLLRKAPNDKGYRADLAETYQTLLGLLHAIGERKEEAELAERAKQLLEKK